jgi:amino acid transporter
MSFGELEHTLLPKTIALPVFSSDALSSVAYATQEILLVLGLAGIGALSHLIPISLAVATLLALVVVSYRQTVRAYPSGGGAYIVAHENLGKYPGLLAASALLVDYVLTVAVSVTAGVDAVITAAPSLDGIKIEIALVFVLFVALMNLRGVKESGIFFAIPTYGFILSVFVMLTTGVVRCLGGCPQAASSVEHLPIAQSITLFLILRAFAAGTTALTGVEAISNGVPAFRYPQSKNAASTLVIMGTISISMFIGVSVLAHYMHVVYAEGDPVTVLGQIAHTAFNGGFLFYFVQAMTAAILILAANTAFADFPRLSSILAIDRFMPRQLMNRGDRLVFSNGILVLSVLASLLIVAFHADLNHLIQLYLVGVFVSFTLSQSGMVVHWRKTQEPGWRRSAVINGFGAVMTAVVLCVVIATKFRGGAWIVCVAIPIVMYLMNSVHKHYSEVRAELIDPARVPTERRPGNQHMVIYVHQIDAATVRAVRYARSIRPNTIVALTTAEELRTEWERLAPEIPLETLKGASVRECVRVRLREQRKGLSDDDFLTLIVPELFHSTNFFSVVRRLSVFRLKTALLRESGVQVLDIPVVAGKAVTLDPQKEPARNFVVILVAHVDNRTLHAIEYAETLRATDVRAVSFDLDPTTTQQLGDDWLTYRIPHPLEIESSPSRDIGESLLHYVRELHPDGIERVVTVVVPEFIVGKKRHQILHQHTPLVVKRKLLFEKGVVVVSVPYFI